VLRISGESSETGKKDNRVLGIWRIRHLEKWGDRDSVFRGLGELEKQGFRNVGTPKYMRVFS